MPVPDVTDMTDISDAPDVADTHTLNSKEIGSFNLSNERELRTELRRTFNCLGVDNDLNTPDYLLAEVVIEHLKFLGNLTKKRDDWHGFVPFADFKKTLEG